MTSRRSRLIEEGARQDLYLNGYHVEIIPFGWVRGYPPAHLVATRGENETRLIRIRKLYHLPPIPEILHEECSQDIAVYRKHLSLAKESARPRCEIWLYTLKHGFRCYEILKESIREVPKIPASQIPASSQKGAV